MFVKPPPVTGVFDGVRFLCVTLLDLYNDERLSAELDDEVQTPFLVGVTVRDTAFTPHR